MDLRAPVEPGPVASAVRARLREAVEGPATDRYLAPEIEAAYSMVLDGSLLQVAADIVSERGGELV